ncbi:MAG: DUF4430 domain-containing protein [Lachnospiraceae bacterium]|nr:DUF4430 domain-containing protein [Lachnospiraceae bacterium]
MKKFSNIFQNIKEFILERKGYCLGAVILILFFFLILPQLEIETVSQHNEKQSAEISERQSILEELATGEEKESILEDSTTETNTEPETDINTEINSETHTETDAERNAEINTDTDTEAGKEEITIPVNTAKQPEETTRTQQNNNQTTSQEDRSNEQNTTEVATEKEYFAVTIKISCEQILTHPDLNTQAKLPESGVFYQGTIGVRNGETVLDVLGAACSEQKISYVNQSSGFGAYISSIGGLSEKECGKYSGWKYKVNGEIPPLSCDKYKLHENDEILWYYAADYDD